MEVMETELPGVLVIEPRIFRDERGSFLETWREEQYSAAGITGFRQDNAAISKRGVLRGLHFQFPEPQGKLVMVLHGEVFDVAVDIRRRSPTFGRWISRILSADNGRQLWLPEGIAHGYQVLSDAAVFSYKCTRPFNPRFDAAIRFDDPAIGIEWPIADPITSAKDRSAPLLEEIPTASLPSFDPSATSIEAISGGPRP
ncbi:MAG: dTDP-4-dehydrorhamnose 3,5-epimerase [Gemmatimonas sp.]|nr:dTDP-4-dehydrorhamnose 3,5-epimerase [Gemmatimonas sp.]